METKFSASRTVREKLRLPYEPLLRELMITAQGEDFDSNGPLRLSDKIAARICNVSERQIRKARLEGMDPYLADHLCIKGLGLHPMLVYGDEWLTAEAMWAEEIWKREMDPEDIQVSYEDACEDVWDSMDSVAS